MPYIKADDRVQYERPINDMFRPGSLPPPGDLNYVITRLCLKYLAAHGECYQTYNEIVGVLESAKLEFYRTHVAPYENVKRSQNGEVTK
jgi:hypothetical protein